MRPLLGRGRMSGSHVRMPVCSCWGAGHIAVRGCIVACARASVSSPPRVRVQGRVRAQHGAHACSCGLAGAWRDAKRRVSAALLCAKRRVSAASPAAGACAQTDVRAALCVCARACACVCVRARAAGQVRGDAVGPLAGGVGGGLPRRRRPPRLLQASANTHTHTRTRTHARTHAHTHTQAQAQAQEQEQANTRARTHIHTIARTHARTHTPARRNGHKHARTHTSARARTHTHTAWTTRRSCGTWPGPSAAPPCAVTSTGAAAAARLRAIAAAPAARR